MKRFLTAALLSASLAFNVGCQRKIEATELLSDNPMIRDQAFKQLKELSMSRKQLLVEPLIQALHDQNQSVVQRATEALALIGPPSVSKLIVSLKDSDVFIRMNAAYALGCIHPPAPETVPALSEALKDPHPLVREEAVVSLGNIGPAAGDAVPSLIYRLKDPSPDVQEQTLLALKKIGTIEATQALAAIPKTDKKHAVK